MFHTHLQSVVQGPVHKVTIVSGESDNSVSRARHYGLMSRMTDISISVIVQGRLPDPSLDTGTSSTLASGGKGYSMSDMLDLLGVFGEAVIGLIFLAQRRCARSRIGTNLYYSSL